MWDDTDIYDEETGTFYGYGEDEYTCPHGTYIGTPGGPDILCGWCEEGISRQEYKEIMRAQRLHGIRDRAKMHCYLLLTEGVFQTFRQIPGHATSEKFIEVANAMIDEIETLDTEYLLSIENEVYGNGTR